MSKVLAFGTAALLSQGAAALSQGAAAARIRAASTLKPQPCFCGVPQDAALIVLDMQNDFLHDSSVMKVTGGLELVPAINAVAALPGWKVVGYGMTEHASKSVLFASTHGKQPFEEGMLTYSVDLQHGSKLCGEEFAQMYGTDHAKALCPESENLVHFPQTFWPDHCVNDTWGQRLARNLEVPPHAFTFAKRGSPMVDGYSAFQNVLGEPWNDLAERLHHLGVKTLFLAGLVQNMGIHYTARDAGRLGYQTYVLSDATVPATDAGLTDEELQQEKELANAQNKKVGALLIGAKDFECCR